MVDCHDDISSLSAFIHIGMRLGRVLQRIIAIDDRLELARLGQICKTAQIIQALCHDAGGRSPLMAAPSPGSG